MSDSNATPGPDTISFNVPSVPVSIAVSETLSCTDPVTIDATTQPGYAGKPLVALIGSTGDGIHLAAGGSLVRGLSLEGFTSAIAIDGPGGNRVEGCYIGTDLTGTIARTNQFGVFIRDSPGNVVGGAATTQRNLISGVQNQGVRIEGSGSTDTIIQGNYFGLDVTGTVLLTNGSGVLSWSGASGTVVGGAAPGEGNVFAGAYFEAISIRGGSNAVIRGNLVGVDASGEASPTGEILREGITLENASDTLIGGTAAGAGNVIAGTSTALRLFNVTRALVQGNRIGTNRSGTKRMQNTTGIDVYSSSDVVIGGSESGASNLVSGNAIGVSVILSRGTIVQGNLIGTDVTGTLALGNLSGGIWVGSSALETTIGGSDSAAGNVIAYNAMYHGAYSGVTCSADARILSNSIYANNNGGIALRPSFGHVPNDFPDEDGVQNHPEIWARTVAGGVEISGTLLTTPSQDFTVQVFGNTSCDPSGYGQGRTLLGSLPVHTDSAGSGAFRLVVAAGTYSSVAATATRAGGSTSEFSSCAPVSMPTRYYTLSPCRAVDTRWPNGSYGSPALYPGEVRSFRIAGVCGVPDSSVSVAANVTIVQPGAGGYLGVLPGDGAIPGTSSVSFAAGRTRANNVVVRLSSDGSGFIRIQNASTAPTHVILDLSGYFAP